MSDLNIVSYNVRGLGHPIKRKRILAQLKSLKSSIALLQETHLNDVEHNKLKRHWVDQVFFASCPKSRGRGVAILLSRTSYFSMRKEVKDLQGRYVMVVGSIEGLGKRKP
uniref:Endonuclease/exonuclease/phosphatase domain-containing protein n=1 Tax=Poecilia mexicana TaxID=48701 RepID=A0A3B3XGJ8_9TELE